MKLPFTTDYFYEIASETRKLYRRSFAIAALMSGSFFAVLAILISANALQLAINPPLESPALTILTERLFEDPSDEQLRQEIRELQLLARRAWFSRIYQIERGFYLMAGSFALFMLFLKGWALASGAPLLLRRRSPDTTEGRAAGGGQESLRALSAAGIVIAIVALGSAVYSRQMVRFDPPVAPEASGTEATPAATLDEEEMQAVLLNWPFFRGPWGQAISEETPETGGHVLWSTPVPKKGFSSPVVWEDAVFLTGGNAEALELYRFDLETGELVWQRSLEEIFGSPRELPGVTEDTGYAAPTPALDGERIFAIFASGDLVCLDFGGRTLWMKSLGIPDNLYGHSSSLITYGSTLFVQFDHNEEALLYAFDTATGEELWKQERDVVTSWASPVIIHHNGVSQLVLNADPWVIAYDPEGGDELWRADCMGGEVAVSIGWDGERVYAANQYAVAAAIDPGDGTILWEEFIDLPEVSSPLAKEGLLFMATSYGVVTCRDGATGELLWEAEFDEGFYSSPIEAGGIIYLADRGGTVHIFEAAAEYQAIGSFSLGEACDATPAVADGSLLFRTENRLVRVGEGQ
jgi:outer membrane protein assembly factor BamB